MEDLLNKLIPDLDKKSKSRRMQISRAFTEVHLAKGTVLENESSYAKFFWILIDGEIDVYKKPDFIYDL